jgi:hypothetical protein
MNIYVRHGNHSINFKGLYEVARKLKVFFTLLIKNYRYNRRPYYKKEKNECASTVRKLCTVCVRKRVDVLNALPPAKFPLFVAEGHSILFYSPWV